MSRNRHTLSETAVGSIADGFRRDQVSGRFVQ
jgi:hypothetical protein